MFTAFTQPQILELKEIFNLLDTTSDGYISTEDLRSFLDSIGAPLGDEEIGTMMGEMGDPFNFTLFLTALCEKLSNLDSENVIVSALRTYDEADTGFIGLDSLREALLQRGEGVSPGEFQLLVKECKLVDGRVSIRELARTIKHCGLLPS